MHEWPHQPVLRAVVHGAGWPRQRYASFHDWHNMCVHALFESASHTPLCDCHACIGARRSVHASYPLMAVLCAVHALRRDSSMQVTRLPTDGSVRCRACIALGFVQANRDQLLTMSRRVNVMILGSVRMFWRCGRGSLLRVRASAAAWRYTSLRRSSGDTRDSACDRNAWRTSMPCHALHACHCMAKNKSNRSRAWFECCNDVS